MLLAIADQPELNPLMGYPSVAGLFFRVILTLLFIIFVAYFVLKIIKRQQSLRQNLKKWVKIFDYQALGTNQGLYLMEIYDLVCIVAVSDGQINILKEIDPETEKWGEVQENLLETESYFIDKMSSRFFRKDKRDLTEPDFQEQLTEQFHKNRHFSRDLFQGGKTRE